jgi:hypothetical protein
MLGIYLTFISKPPTEELARARQTAAERGREMMDGMIEQSLLTPGQIRAAGEEAARKEEQKLEFSVVGVRLLLLGIAAQLVGTVGQVIILICRR